MKNYHFPMLAVLLLCLLACQQEQDAESPGRHLPLSIFEIPTNKDTLLVGPGGIRLDIPATKWKDEQDQIVDGSIYIHLIEALTVSDILIGELSTTTDSALLVSDGMFYWEAKDQEGNTLVPEYVIRVKVPVKSYLPKAKLFRGEISSKGMLKWKKQIAIDEEVSEEELKAGRSLFKNLCASCHKIDKALTGPALAGATFRFEQGWLYDYTRDPIKMMNEGDSIALSLYSRWGTMMMPYPDLTDQEIKSIYDFIDYHAKRLPLKKLKEIHRKNTITPADHFYYYASSIQFPGWFWIAQRDIDKLVDLDYQVKLSLSKAERPSVALVFPDKTFIYKGRLNAKGNFFFSYEFDSKNSLLPLNQDVLIVATAYKNGKTYLGVKENTVKDGFTEKIKMEAMPREEIWERLERIFQD